MQTSAEHVIEVVTHKIVEISTHENSKASVVSVMTVLIQYLRDSHVC
jgi:hypothetical protein